MIDCYAGERNLVQVILNLFQNPIDDILDFLEWTIDND